MMAAPIRPKTTNMSESERDECLRLRSEGWTLIQLAVRYDRNWKTIGRMIARKGGRIGRRLYHQDAGMVVAGEYSSWRAMKKRCYNDNDPFFHRYGGRGIKVCNRWLASYEKFLADMGRRPTPKHSIDRYPDPDGNYEPKNYRWATADQQGKNKSRKAQAL